MSRQALSIERMKHLQELGLKTSNGSAYWYRIIQNKGDGNIRVISDWKLAFSLDIAYCTGHTLESIKSFTLQDIFDLLPSEIEENSECNILSIDKFSNDWYIRYGLSDEFEPLISFEFKNLIDAAYEMLCWVLTNKYIQ